MAVPAVPVLLGLRTKTARAVGVVARRATEGPSGVAPLTLVRRFELPLFDPAIPATREPYHPSMNLPWIESEKAASPLAHAVAAAACGAFERLLFELAEAGLEVERTGIVGGGQQEPARIGNPHIRAHAAEGRLFFAALAQAVASRGFTAVTLPEKTPWEKAAGLLGMSPEALRIRAASAGRGVLRPYGADEKLAALAAWAALAGC